MTARGVRRLPPECGPPEGGHHVPVPPNRHHRSAESLALQRLRYVTALSVISSPRSMIANASRISASVMHSGGVAEKDVQRSSVVGPPPRENNPTPRSSSHRPPHWPAR